MNNWHKTLTDRPSHQNVRLFYTNELRIALTDRGAGAGQGSQRSAIYPCRTRLSSSSFALDPSTCASRPAAPCPARDAGVDPRYRDPLQPSDDIAYELFHECARGQGNFSVGVTFTEQGCADRFYSVPFPPDDELLQCYLRVLQARRYPCGITCSHYIRLD